VAGYRYAYKSCETALLLSVSSGYGKKQSMSTCVTPTSVQPHTENGMFLSLARRLSDVSMYGSATALCDCSKAGEICVNCLEQKFHSPARPSTPID
ncbi:hypothetical protein QYM36_012493, partial [Artemia franciscana]